MPKATIHEDDLLPTWERQIWTAGQAVIVEAISKPEAMHEFSDSQFGLGILRANARH